MNRKVVILTIFVIGAIFLIVGVGATLNRTQTAAACEACLMEIIKTASSTHTRGPQGLIDEHK